MIISHKHKFIFFKTRKTAGSSIQVQLANYCGEDDIITGQYRDGIDDDSHSTGLNMDKFYTNHPHPTLKETRLFLGEEIWNSYFKFAFVRNPFDIAVSRYFWEKKGKSLVEQETSIDDFKKWTMTELKDYDRQLSYIEWDGEIALDFVGRYETLKEDYRHICQKLNLPVDELPFKKSGFRDKKHYTKFYDDETIQRVTDFFDRDIDLLNYNFNQKFMTKRICPIILSDNLQDENDNINGPSLIKVPDWIENPLGKYYLYFAHHQGSYIKMAYSDKIDGPYTEYKNGVINLDQTICKSHIASPDVHIDNDKKQIVMYYHGDTTDEQRTFISYSNDGLSFTDTGIDCGPFYFRVFKYKDKLYSVAKNKKIDSVILESDNWEGEFKPLFNFLEKSRHTSVFLEDDDLYIFYSLIGDTPESIRMIQLKLDTDINNWDVIHMEKILKPELKYEGSEYPIIPSMPGSSTLRYGGGVNEVRDPYIYVENKNIYLLYTLAGELGIGLAKIDRIDK